MTNFTENALSVFIGIHGPSLIISAIALTIAGLAGLFVLTLKLIMKIKGIK